MTIRLRVGGVPEHFNYIWHLPRFAPALAEQGIAVDWHDYPGGTGAMCADLREQSLDLALLLTEGAVADIAKGSPCRVVGTWVESPLCWGIHASAQRGERQLPGLSEATYAISRYGSGSHLMAIINCKIRGLPLPTKFEVVGNLDGARQALADGAADLFMWEKFTTKFLVDAGEFQRIDECDTPWPCFVLVVREEVIDKHPKVLRKLIDTLRRFVEEFPPAACRSMIAERYQLDPEDVDHWAETVAWSARPSIDPDALAEVIDGLLATEVLTEPIEVEQIVAHVG